MVALILLQQHGVEMDLAIQPTIQALPAESLIDLQMPDLIMQASQLPHQATR